MSHPDQNPQLRSQAQFPCKLSLPIPNDTKKVLAVYRQEADIGLHNVSAERAGGELRCLLSLGNSTSHDF